MAKFICENKECEKYGQELITNHVRWKWNKLENCLKHDINCSYCSQLMTYKKEEKEGDIDVYFGKFRALSPIQKKEVLKKRAHIHNKTKMKDRIPEVRKRLTGM